MYVIKYDRDIYAEHIVIWMDVIFIQAATLICKSRKFLKH